MDALTDGTKYEGWTSVPLSQILDFWNWVSAVALLLLGRRLFFWGERGRHVNLIDLVPPKIKPWMFQKHLGKNRTIDRTCKREAGSRCV